MIWNTRLKEICFQKHTYCFSHEKFNLAHFKEPSFSAFPSRWAFKKYCKNCHIQCHTLEGTYIHNLPLHCCGTLHIHSLPTDTTSITNLYTYYNLSYERTEFKIILSTSNYMFYFLYLSRIQVKPQIFKVVENELSDERL